MRRRAVAPVLGLVLLIGITAVSSMALLVVGASLTESTQSSAETAQAQSSLAQFAESADAIATGEADRSHFEIRGSEEADVIADPDAGRIRVTVMDSSDDVVFELDQSFGALVYEDGDTKIAHQGGGVWRKDGDQNARMVSSPQFHYREDPDPTLTFPVIRVTEEFSDSADVSGEMVATNKTTHYPDAPNHSNPLQDGSVKIEVESEYCEGWEQFFRERTDGDVSETCENNDGTVVVTLSVPFEIDEVDGGVMIGNSENLDTEDFDGIDDEDEFGDVEDADSATPLVEEKVEEAIDDGEGEPLPDLDSASEIDGPDPGDDEPRLYYDDGDLAGNYDVTINTTHGDVTIVSNEDEVLTGQEDLDITGGGNVTIFAEGDVLVEGGGSGQIGEPDKEDQLSVFVHSDYNVGAGGQSTDFYGLLYAPNSEVDLGTDEDTALSGAVVADDLDVGNAGFEIDDETTNAGVYYGLGDAPFYYLHISETEIEFRDD